MGREENGESIGREVKNREVLGRSSRMRVLGRSEG